MSCDSQNCPPSSSADSPKLDVGPGPLGTILLSHLQKDGGIYLLYLFLAFNSTLARQTLLSLVSQLYSGMES